MHSFHSVEKGYDYRINVYIDIANKRLRVDQYLGNSFSIMNHLKKLVQDYGVFKVIIYAKSNDIENFLSRGFVIEGILKNYFDGIDAYIMAYYYDMEHRTSDHWIEEDNILQNVLKLDQFPEVKKLDPAFNITLAQKEDAEQLADLYKNIFDTYPTPVNDKNYIEKVMKEGTLFYVIKLKQKIISVASAEINKVFRNAEITDCATLPEYRKHGFMKLLILSLEQQLIKQHIFSVYSLARALSFGMNASFHQLGYQYTGRLIKNCDIAGKFEDMNVWNKNLSEKVE